jgi:hypothetical protein
MLAEDFGRVRARQTILGGIMKKWIKDFLQSIWPFAFAIFLFALSLLP